MTDSPSISLCMIVKDEEAMLPACLSSVRGYVDEIIIVDTGSRDRSVAIAQKYGARVFHHSWENDFSKHRNQAIGYASSDWILVLDADEELKAGSGGIMREAVKDDKFDSIELTNISSFNKGSSEAWVRQVRIFRNRPDIHYSDIVHEQLVGLKRTGRFPIFVFHRGYDLEKEASDKKHERNVRLIKEQIRRKPDSFFYHFNLAVSYSTHFEYERAVDEGIIALDLAHKKGIRDDNVLWAQYIVASAYLKLDDLDNAERYALAAANLSRNDLDSRFVLVLVYHRKKDWKRLKQVSPEILDLFYSLNRSPQDIDSRFIHMANEEWRVHIALGDMHLHHGDIDEAAFEFNTAESLASNSAECDQIIGDCYRKKEFWQEAQAYYRSSLSIKDDNTASLFGMALVKKALGKTDEYKELIFKIDLKEVEDHDILFEKGLIELKEERFETSIEFFNRAIVIKPDSYHAHQDLALAYKFSGRIEDAIKTNLKAIELRPQSVDAMINLGYLFYESDSFDKSRDLFESALSLEPALVDIRILLCDIHIRSGDIEGCVRECDAILRSLDHPVNMSLNSLADLAGLFIILAQLFTTMGKKHLTDMAVSLAHRLDPMIDKKLDEAEARSALEGRSL